jgi:hypothetical protein
MGHRASIKNHDRPSTVQAHVTWDFQGTKNPGALTPPLIAPRKPHSP